MVETLVNKGCRIYKDKINQWNLLWYVPSKWIPNVIKGKTKQALITKAKQLGFDFYFDCYSNKKIALK